MISSGDPRRGLRGRRDECAALDRLLADARSGRSQVLVLRGEAGIGKSALVDHLVANAAGCRIARAAGVESQMELAFAGVHQLCAPMLGELDRLPDAQRAALSVAFGLSTGSAPDRFMVGLAVLSLLAELAEDEPLVCVVDDAQWLDRVSAQTLAFVARRLLAERVTLVFAVRAKTLGPGDDPLVGLRELVVGGLRDGDARTLLDSVLLGRVDERVRDRIVAEARGNPLALLELPKGLTAGELAGGFGRPDARPLASQIEQSFLRRVGSLPAATRRLLLAAAAEPVGDLSLLRRAAERLAVGADAAAAAEETGLIELGTQVRFRHPLVRSAVYRAADPFERREVHRALAEATDPRSDAERRAWHRAQAAAEPDEDVAGELERCAGQAQARGGVGAAAAFLRRATGLTPDPARRGARAVAAAQATFEAGDPDAALELIAAAEIGPLDELQRGLLAWLRGRIAFARRRGGEAMPLLLDAAGQLARAGDGRAREAYLETIGSAVSAGRLGEPGALRKVAEAARAAPPGPQPPRLVDTLLDGLVTRLAEGYVQGAPPLHRALVTFRQEAGDKPDETMRWHWLAWLAAADMWDDETWHELAVHAVRGARENGALNFLPLALNYRGVVHVYAGEFEAAAALVEESNAILKVTGNSHLAYARLMLQAWRGDATTHAVLEAGAEWASTWKEGRASAARHYFNALLYNGFGQYRAALSSARQACEHEDLGMFGFALAELVEAGTRADAPEAAADALRRLEERATASGTEWALGVLARSRALLSRGATADRLYRESVERLAHSRVAVDLARTHLVYGEWLRRENRRRDAREHLHTAHEMLRGFGAEAFAERARRELLATGESVRRRTAEARDALTAQETQIARLAGEGKTNSEIGAELFISPRTVEWHLRKVFTKLGVDSRKQLRGAPAGH
ncbi:helix-turn-helix transcriptional regulator [Amycolatopsis vastitatis]|uniref:LuxR family transcriptional regulator n=1 Tax=Amycolatopsis vastitatis TaxID=1905142 RepID=A0A229T138_9PSEU|nr:LuxR family transcriptional regulator [Amycolatopsis vastitatis]OXM64700.1 LuxR family transcriptional regulator [Amycolatopsis vastitatis]